MTGTDAGTLSPGTSAVSGQSEGYGVGGEGGGSRCGNAVSLLPVDVLKEADSPRQAGIDPAHVALLAENVDQLPPILVHRPTLRVIDGMHRLHAARLANREHVKVMYFDGPETEAFLLAVRANIEHGLPLSLTDRKRSARRILRSFPEWSDRAIAENVGLSSKTVGALRRVSPASGAQPVVRVGRDGRARPLNPAEGRLRAAAVLARRPEASLRDIAKSAGISVETARSVRNHVTRRESPLPGRTRRPGLHSTPDQEADRTANQEADPTADQKGERKRPLGASTAWRRQSVDLDTALASLKKDPALKYSLEGRAMLRWLEARMIRGNEAELVMRAPTHQAPKIAAMARGFAEHWHEIAMRLESQTAEA
ncbi:ParB/RepB/Spo0J family partition protein [Streptomyces scopuliridis]|uniref:ParB/RepB/Spo0J family partition protein n=1 Tax=Streptomyces scopuliridis TaxID=452529 RepID=UPI0035DDE0D6